MKDFENINSLRVNYFGRSYELDYRPKSSSGLADLDRFIGGLYLGQLITFVGDIGSGKTVALINIFLNQSEAHFISVCESKDRTLLRIVSSLYKIRHDTLVKGEIVEKDLIRLQSKTIENSRRNLDLCSISHSKSDILGLIRELANMGKKIIFIDEIESIDDVVFFSPFVKYLKKLAEELNICIIISSYLSRYNECTGEVYSSPSIDKLDSELKIQSDIIVVLDRVAKDGILCFKEDLQSKHFLEGNVMRNKNGGTGYFCLWLEGCFQTLSAITCSDKLILVQERMERDPYSGFGRLVNELELEIKNNHDDALNSSTFEV